MLLRASECRRAPQRPSKATPWTRSQYPGGHSSRAGGACERGSLDDHELPYHGLLFGSCWGTPDFRNSLNHCNCSWPSQRTARLEQPNLNTSVPKPHAERGIEAYIEPFPRSFWVRMFQMNCPHKPAGGQ